MRKYQQLLFVSLAVVSFVCFLIYKHEYDKIRNVLEVLEVFGSPPSNQQLPPVIQSPSIGGNGDVNLNVNPAGVPILDKDKELDKENKALEDQDEKVHSMKNLVHKIKQSRLFGIENQVL